MPAESDPKFVAKREIVNMFFARAFEEAEKQGFVVKYKHGMHPILTKEKLNLIFVGE